ncbi:hypothetical protein ACIA48_03710 [Mycobacterium sp. NPDC051804]|uniref:hypothetical protein n=1 Tax=Mycobacterium sp. NPDC051804 TaxID=3364295 RepID=UPI0037B843B4
MSTEVIIVVVTLTVVALATIGWLVWFVRHMRGLRDPVFSGDPVPGTAQVTSARTIGGFFSRYGRPAEVKCEFGLRVRLPGRAPYDTTIRQVVGVRRVELSREQRASELYAEAEPYEGPTLRPGANVVVAADSADPQVVRIDLTQPVD